MAVTIENRKRPSPVWESNGKGKGKGKGKSKGTFTHASVSLNNVNVSNRSQNNISSKIRRQPPVRSKTQNNISRKIAQRKMSNDFMKELRKMVSKGLTLKERKALDQKIKGTGLNETPSFRKLNSSKHNLNLNANLLIKMDKRIPSKPHYVNGNMPHYPDNPPWYRSDSPPYIPPDTLPRRQSP
jgi:hypothetical protein